MSEVDKLKINPEGAIWEQLSDMRDVMLGATGGGSHLQPMAPQADVVRKVIWFYTSKVTDLAVAAQQSPAATLCLISENRDFHASLDGTLSIHHDRKIIEEFWSPIVAAWYPDGKDDDDLTMMCFKPTSAGVWASVDSAIKFGWEIAKANAVGTMPNVGFHTIVRW